MLHFLTAGESHGQALVAILEGVPAGLPLDEEYIARDLARRQRGYGRGGRMKIERDHAQILSGVRHGLTLGSPISLLIPNRDWENWKGTMSVAPVAETVEPVTRVRPGHADLPGAIKYGQDDVRSILERASARETAARVAAGAVARRFLQEFGLRVSSHTLAIGGHWAKMPDVNDWAGVLPRLLIEMPEVNYWDAVEASPLRCVDARAAKAMAAAIDCAREQGDTLGGVFEVIATGVPIGLGSHVHWERKLSTKIATALMSINAVKGVEIGDGFRLADMLGSQSHDKIQRALSPSAPPWERGSNHAGGIEGGMSNGEAIVVRAAVKPIPTLGKPLPSLDLRSGEEVQAHIERSDVCVVPAAGVIGEAMLCLVLADCFLEKFGGDHVEETRRNYKGYLDSIAGRGKQ